MLVIVAVEICHPQNHMATYLFESVVELDQFTAEVIGFYDAYPMRQRHSELNGYLPLVVRTRNGHHLVLGPPSAVKPKGFNRLDVCHGDDIRSRTVDECSPYLAGARR